MASLAELSSLTSCFRQHALAPLPRESAAGAAAAAAGVGKLPSPSQSAARCRAATRQTATSKLHWMPSRLSQRSRGSITCAPSAFAAAAAVAAAASPSQQDTAAEAAAAAAVEAAMGGWSADDRQEARRLGLRLFNSVRETKRGEDTDAEQRAIIEEAQVELETFRREGAGLQSGTGLDLLHGLWRLKYSSASDVLGILRLQSLTPFPLVQVGDIYQKFECAGQKGGGTVQNIVQWSIHGLLQENEGVRLVVMADFSVRSDRSIQLEFREAKVDSVRISDALQAVIAPAIVPRTQLSMEILQRLQELALTVPLGPVSPIPNPNNSPLRSSVGGGRYILTFVDDHVLVGRAVAPLGSFIFERA